MLMTAPPRLSGGTARPARAQRRSPVV